MIPDISTSSKVFALNVCWKPKFQRRLIRALHLRIQERNICPTNVSAPPLFPAGLKIPVGNGSLSVAGPGFK
jgi:hypothetical protein